jgi:hypothetical protein
MLGVLQRLGKPDVRDALHGMIKSLRLPKPDVRVPGPSNAEAAGRIGTAIDYAIRFGIYRRGWAETHRLVAMRLFDYVEKCAQSDIQRALRRDPDLDEAGLLELPDFGSRLFAFPGDDPPTAEAMFVHLEQILSEAERAFAAWEDDAQLPADVARALIQFSLMDLFAVLRRIEPRLWEPVAEEEIRQVQALYSLVPWEQLRPRRRALLNPHFSAQDDRSSIGDADLLIDDTIIDIKASSDTGTKSRYLHQLVTYALLANQHSIWREAGDTVQLSAPVTRVGIYYARAGVLRTWALEELLAPEDHNAVLEAVFPAPR